MRRVPALLALVAWAGGCATGDERKPPVIVLPARSESRTPVYDHLSPGDREEVDATLGRCRDAVLGCTEDFARLETGAPVAMALAERACGEGRSDLCARLARLHLREVGPGTSRAEGVWLLNVACQARVASACLNLAIVLRETETPAQHADVQALLRFACEHGQPVACALEEEPISPKAAGVVVAPASRPDAPRDVATPVGAKPVTASASPLQGGAVDDRSIESLLAPGRVLLLGAVFGTREAPDATARLVRASLERGYPTVLALDIDTSERARLDQFLRGPGDADALTELLKGFWQRAYQDGRSSQAVLRLILQARQLIVQGLPLRLAAIDEPLEGPAKSQAIAGRLEQVIQAYPDRVVISLLGNLQAARVTMVLREAGHPVTALHLAHDGGFTWSCRDPKAPVLEAPPAADRRDVLRNLECREILLIHRESAQSWNAVGTIVIRARTAGQFRLYPVDPEREVFDDVFPIGLVSASPPALSPRR